MRYLEGISLDAFGRGNRRMLAPVLAWAKEPVAVPVPEAAAEGEKPAKDSPAKTPDPKTRRRVGVRHLGYATGGAFFLWPVVGGWVPTVTTTASAVWVVAALIAGQQGGDEHDPGAEGDDDQEHPQDAESAPDRGTALLLHVLTALSDAEFSKRKGVHLDVVLSSAVASGLLAEETEVADLRGWVESTGLPTVDKLGMRIDGQPVTRVGLRVDAATEALGMSPTALLNARSEAFVGASGEAPAKAFAVPVPVRGEEPAEAAPSTSATTPAQAPVPAALRLILGGRADRDQTPSPALAQGQVQGAR